MRRLLPLSVAAVSLSLCGWFANSASAAAAPIGTSVPEVRMSGVAFGDAVDFLRDVSGLNIVVNWKALEAQGIGRDVPINLRLHHVTVRKALEMMLSEAGGDAIGYEVDQGVVDITTREEIDSHLVTRVYPVQDLIMEIPDFIDAPDFSLNSTSNNSTQNPGSGNSNSAGSSGGGGNSIFNGSPGKEKVTTREERAQALVELIMAVVQPECWAENGGKSAIRYFNGSLIVTAPRSVQLAIGGY